MRSMSSGILLLGLVALGAEPATAQKRSRDLITRAEVLKVEGATTAYDIVRRIHPEWLRTSGVRTVGGRADPVQVYVNDRKEGGPEALSNVQANAIGEMRHLDASEAESHYGQNHGSGAILITLYTIPPVKKDPIPPLKPR